MRLGKVLLLWGLLLLAQGAGAIVPATPQPRQITVADGLPSSSINGFAEDPQGYLWLASADGLARYDGNNYRIWRIEDGLRDNMLWSVHVDARNRVWIGTQNAGMAMLSADRRRFHYYDGRGYPQMGSDPVWCITSTADGSVWFGTPTRGLFRLDPGGRMQRFMPVPGDEHSLPSKAVNFLAQAPDGTLWVGTKDGLAAWNGDGFDRVDADALPSSVINGLTVEAGGRLWIATMAGVSLRHPDGRIDPHPWKGVDPGHVLQVLLRDADGGYWLDTLSGMGRAVDGQVRNVPLYSKAAQGLVKPNWSTGFQDREGGLWFASPNTGLWHLPANWQQFAVLGNRHDDPSTMTNPYVLANAAAADGRIWLAGTRGALDRLDPATGAIEHHLRQINGLRWPLSVLEDRARQVWVGMFGALVRYDPASGQVRRWHAGDATDAALPGEATLMRQTTDGTLWIYTDMAGLQLRDPAGRVLRHIAPGTHGLAQRLTVSEMRIGPDGAIWLATSEGLKRWNAAADSFEQVPGAPLAAVYAFQVADTSVAWLAGMGALEKYLWDGRRLQLLDRIGRDQQFPALAPTGLVVDASGVAWVASMRGLIRVDPATRAIRIYGAHDGISNPQLRQQTLLQSRGGQIVGATPDGLILFEPHRVRPATRQPPLAIEHVGVRRGERAVDLTHAGRMLIEDGDRDLQVVAHLLSFSDADANQYRFRLSGYDPDWVDVGSSGERLFSRLPPGRYLLEVQGQTADGVWSQVQTLRFQVLPPWWRSDWGIALAVLLAMAMAVLAAWLYRRRLQRRHAWQLALQKQELAEQASLAKTRFLATLGHEVRTPMTGVLGMSELLLATPLDGKQRSYTESIRRAGSHLLRLVNDALDLARIEAGRLDLEPQHFDLRQLVAEVEGLMAPMAVRRGLRFELDNALPAVVTAYGDPMRVRQILLNLLGNAIKFTERGQVSLRISSVVPHHMIRFQVIDTGPGIGAEQKARLFRRFEQADGARTAARYGGSGLGLAICQELALAMGGHIEVDSQLGAGSRFSVDLPLPWAESAVAAAAPAEAAAAAVASPLCVLLVEDDPTIAEVIAGLLRMHGHTVHHAAHGLAALAETTATRFDLALLDLDLPGLDGLALARQLRALGQDMPLIAVTARTDAEAEPQARAAGFDGFLRKPVTGRMLAEAMALVRE
ncbi:ATP-binding protein [Stenotrophomonas sp. MMGLT7]|uniref:hybrid sensor histidine kinase/response regulator n=1 Tax=Stenotrophomonas sp. MMGLT7 TaxID=2901227 RepID=UPI001E56E517|nr:ATP-binding protein [Stenotrophomonas sp. MMGLT7]MCD7100036.1 ATP-binding protein [Stenotrophomonas sp. MMGLT7]